MRIERHKNFLSLENCAALNAWVDEGVKKKWLDAGVTVNSAPYEATKRVTSRMYGHRFDYPQIVLNISSRIRKFCGVDSYGLIEGHGKNGVVVSCTFNRGNIHPHCDPKNDGLSALRCNVMTRAANAGAELYVGGQLVDVEVGELHCYLASDFEHYVTDVAGETPRILWMFGAYVPKEDWESGKIQLEKVND